jgi:hypothetical protein
VIAFVVFVIFDVVRIFCVVRIGIGVVFIVRVAVVGLIGVGVGVGVVFVVVIFPFDLIVEVGGVGGVEDRDGAAALLGGVFGFGEKLVEHLDGVDAGVGEGVGVG